jgi:hypothetical protein
VIWLLPPVERAGDDQRGATGFTSSTVNAPAGYIEGTTVAAFTQPTGGTVVIQPWQ